MYKRQGLAYKETSDTGVRWRVVHKLNQCGSPQADLYRQGLGEFFLDDPWEYRAGFAVLAPEVQMKLHALLHDNVNVQRLHQADYNMLAYPWAQRYQQSNQWAIETLAMAMEPGASTRERAQAWLQFKGYQPSTLRLNAMTRLGARMTAANIAFDDHPNDKRYGDRIETVTADSVFQWLERAALAGRVQVVRYAASLQREGLESGRSWNTPTSSPCCASDASPCLLYTSPSPRD